jgi:hypothetical protein
MTRAFPLPNTLAKDYAIVTVTKFRPDPFSRIPIIAAHGAELRRW